MKTRHKRVQQMKHQHLVLEHLEKVSSKMLDEHQRLIRDYIRGKNGIYALYRGPKLYYVGLATDLRGRLKAHLRDRLKGSWDLFSIYLTADDHYLKELESLILRVASPKGNNQGGNLPGSKNLLKQLDADIRAHQNTQRRNLLGRPLLNTRPTKLSKISARRVPSLSGYFQKPTWIRLTYKGREYRAKVATSGHIRLDGQIYNSPSMAGKRIYGRNINGWGHWKYQASPGLWVPIDALRKHPKGK